MLYFKGCTAREKLNNVSQSTEKLLNLAKINYETLENEKCCGSILLRVGFFEEAKEQMMKNINQLRDQKILVSCSGCYKALKEDYKKILGVELDVIHTSQLFDELIANNILKVKKSNISVTYHDPCHLGRHCGEFESPRNVINSIAILNEMKNNKENSFCCGSGGGVKSAHPEIADSISKLRLKDAEETQCDALITTCPFCNLNLDKNSSFDVLDISEFVLNNIKK